MGREVDSLAAQGLTFDVKGDREKLFCDNRGEGSNINPTLSVLGGGISGDFSVFFFSFPDRFFPSSMGSSLRPF